MLWFKVSHLVGTILDFPQKIGDLIAHHPAGPCIAVHEQRPRRGEFFRGMKLGIQIHPAPVATHAHLEILTVHRPKRRSIQGIDDIHGVGNGIRAKFLDDIGSQTKHVRGRFHDPPHFQGQHFSPLHFGHLTGVIHIRRVQAQIPVLGPLEEGVQLDAIVLGQLALGDDVLGSCLVVASYEGFQKLLSRRQQVRGGHLIAQEGEFSELMVQLAVVGVQQALCHRTYKRGSLAAMNVSPTAGTLGKDTLTNPTCQSDPTKRMGRGNRFLKLWGSLVGNSSLSSWLRSVT